AKLVREVVLEKVDVAELVDVEARVDVIGEEEAVLERDAVAIVVTRLLRLAGTADTIIGVDVVGVVALEFAEAAVVLAELEHGVEAGAEAKLGAVIRVHRADDVASAADREVVAGEHVVAPSRVVAGT